MPRPARVERMWRRRPLCFPRRTPGGRTSRRDAGRRRPVPQSPGTGVVAAGRPGATSAQARAWYETDTSSWACKPTSRTTVDPLASGLPRRCGPSRKGVVAWGWPRSLLPPGPPPPWFPDRRPQGCLAAGSLAPPATARTRRPAGCDASGLLRQVGAAAMRPPSRVPGNRVSAGSRWSAVCRGPASPPVVPRGSPRVPGAAPSRPARRSAQAGWSLPSCTAPATRPRAALPSPADRNARGMERMHVAHGPPRGSARVQPRRPAFGWSTGAMKGRRT
jgi:hypothetical protein